ncbi:MAG: glycoside hydrolase family 5 protein [Isosphaeraceae bacterium]
MKTRYMVLSLVVLSLAVGGTWQRLAQAAAPPKAGAGDAFAQNQRLGRGVNVLGYDPIWRYRERERFKAEFFKAIHDAGFQHVRINLHPFRDNRGNEGKPRDDYLQTLDWAVDQALANHLMVILDFHEFTEMSRDPVGLKDRYLAIWKTLAQRYKDRPADVLFEILNEPHGKFTAALWNDYLRDALGVIRRTNPERTVVVGPVQWNSIQKLDTLSLPSDDHNIIATVHYYNPFAFTHQGAPWTNQKDKLGVLWKATPEEQTAIRKDLDTAQAWSKKEHRPIYLGEFGAYDKAEMPSRARYVGFVAREAEKRGWSWAYWQFDSDFILYDVRAGHWIEPLRDALIPGGR